MDKRKSALATAVIFSILAIGSFVLLQEKEPTDISVSSANVTIGDTFSIKISVNPNTAIAGTQCSLRYNPSIVTVSSVMEGKLFSQNGSNTVFAYNQTDNANGTIKWIWGNILNTSGAPKNVSTRGTFAVVTMSARGQGQSPLELIDIFPIAVKVCDSEGIALPIRITNGSVNVKEFRITGYWRFGDETFYCRCQPLPGRT